MPSPVVRCYIPASRKVSHLSASVAEKTDAHDDAPWPNNDVICGNSCLPNIDTSRLEFTAVARRK